MTIQGFLGEILALLQDEVVEIRQDGTIESDGILYQKNHLHTRLMNVMFQVHLVLYQLDDGKNQVGIAQPAENIIKDAQILILHSLGDAMGERSKHDAMDIRKLALDVTSHIKGIIVGITRHANHEVYDCGSQNFCCFFRSRDLRKSWRVTKSQLHIFIVYLLLDTSIIL